MSAVSRALWNNGPSPLDALDEDVSLLDTLNKILASDAPHARSLLMSCCQCSVWVDRLLDAVNVSGGNSVSSSLSSRVSSSRDFVMTMRRIWLSETPLSGWLEAFEAHPRIGQKKHVQERESKEQAAAAATMNEDIATQMHALNEQYYDKFGFVFLICASGVPAPTILAALKDRINNKPAVEFQNAAVEQMKITELRLHKLVVEHTSGTHRRAQARLDGVRRHLAGTSAPLHGEGSAAATPSATAAGGAVRSPITTHVLDTALGRPASNLSIVISRAPLEASSVGTAPPAASYTELGRGATNDDGRVATLLQPPLMPGHYRLRFETGAYLLSNHASALAPRGGLPFYPEVTVDFTISAAQTREHFHVPILLSPFGYSTYRGS
ncbi:5-hydroxyisourate hydrolase [Pseudoscourfieldia marina]